MNTERQNANWQLINADKRVSICKSFNEAVYNIKHGRKSLRLSYEGEVKALLGLFGDNIIKMSERIGVKYSDDEADYLRSIINKITEYGKYKNDNR